MRSNNPLPAVQDLEVFGDITTFGQKPSDAYGREMVVFVESPGGASPVILEELGISSDKKGMLDDRGLRIVENIYTLGQVGMLTTIAEAMTGSLVVDGIVATTSYFGLRKVLSSGKKPKKTEQESAEPDNTLGVRFSLPRQPFTTFLQDGKESALMTAKLTPTYDGITTTGESVLKWLESHSGALATIYFDENRFGPSRQNAFLVKARVSLFELYKTSGSITEHTSRDVHWQAAEEFSGHAKKYAALGQVTLSKANLILPPTDTPQNRNLGTFKRIAQTATDRLADSIENSMVRLGLVGWEDAVGTFVNINPAQFMRSMLALDNNPAELLEAVFKTVEEYTGLEEEFEALCTREEELKRLDSLTGTRSLQHETEQRGIKERKATNTDNRLLALLNVAATVMVRERKQQLQEQHEVMLDAMAKSHESRDMQGVISLYDIAITAIAASDSDPEEQATMGKELLRYLETATKLADGSDETFRRLLQGMKMRFPALNIPMRI